MECCHCGNVAKDQLELKSGIGNTGNIGNTLVIQFLPDFALLPGLKLGVEVSFDVGGDSRQGVVLV